MEDMGEVPESRGFVFQSAVKIRRLDVVFERQRRKIAPFVAAAEFVDHHDALDAMPAVQSTDQHAANEAGAAGDEHPIFGGKTAGRPARRFSALCRFCFAHFAEQRRRCMMPAATPRIASRQRQT